MNSSQSKNRFKVIFLGRGSLGMKVLKGLLKDKSILVEAIFNCPATTEVKYSKEDFKKVAAENRIDFFFFRNLNNEAGRKIIKSFKPDLAVAMLWKNTISKEIISIPRYGFLNCHTGLLPQYRGNACGNWAILNEEDKFGVTVHFMNGDELDNGPIIKQKILKINRNILIGDLMDRTTKWGAKLVLEVVKEIQNKQLTSIKQDEKKASYCYPRLPRDGEINWNDSAKKIFNLIRASGKPYPGAYSYFSDIMDKGKIKKITIWLAHIENHPLKKFYAISGHILRLEQSKKWGVVTGDMKLIILDKIHINNQKVEAKNFFRTVRQRLGLDITELIMNIYNKLNTKYS